MRSRSTPSASRRSGQTLVETALVLVLLITLMMAIFDFGRALLCRLSLNEAAALAAEYGTQIDNISGGGNNFLGDFHGFSGFHVPRKPTAEEKASVQFQDHGAGAKADFTADSAPKVKHGKNWVATEPIGIAQGQVWRTTG